MKKKHLTKLNESKEIAEVLKKICENWNEKRDR